MNSNLVSHPYVSAVKSLNSQQRRHHRLPFLIDQALARREGVLIQCVASQFICFDRVDLMTLTV